MWCVRPISALRPSRRCSLSSARCSVPGSTSGQSTWSIYRRSTRASTAFRSAGSDMSSSPSGDLVSVVIATYNMGHYLPLAVQSVLAQSHPNVDVQIVDDGSTDDTAAILSQWDAHPRVRVHRQMNGGQARAKNQGVALSRGNFVAFLDADDVWLPEKLSRQMPLFAGRSEIGVVYSDYERMDGEGRP